MADDYALARGQRKAHGYSVPKALTESEKSHPLKELPPAKDKANLSPDYLLHHGDRPGNSTFDKNDISPGDYSWAGESASKAPVKTT